MDNLMHMGAAAAMTQDNDEPALANQTDTLEQVIKDVRAMGRESGKGAGARIRMLERCVRGGYTGALRNLDDAERKALKKAGTDPATVDHADVIYRAYVDCEAEKNEHGANTLSVKAANLRAFISLGASVHTDGLERFETFKRVHEELKDTAAQQAGEPKPKPLWDALYAAAVAQNKVKSDLSDDEIKGAMAPPKEEKTREDLVKQALKSLEKAIELPPTDDTVAETEDKALVEARAAIEGLFSMLEFNRVAAPLRAKGLDDDTIRVVIEAQK